jgi:thioredoxin-like negative regulator of GroEL
MNIVRLSKNALKKVVEGKTENQFKCIIKFYSNQCEFCHNLKKDYQKIAEAFENEIHFFAFNTAEHPELDDVIKINGVPTIAFIDVRKNPRISILKDPKKPNAKTWYDPEDIMNFVEDNLNE